MPASVRALTMVTLSVLWCLVADSETHSHSNPPGDMSRSSRDTRAVVLQTIRLSAPDRASYGTWNADGSRIAVADSLNQRVGVWEFPSGRRVPAPENQAGGVHRLAYSPDGRYLAVAKGVASGGADRFSISLWDAGPAVQLTTLVEPDTSELPLLSVRALAFSPDGRYLAASYLSGILLYEIESGGRARRIAAIGRSAARIAFSANGAQLATTSGIETSIHEIPTGRVTGRIALGSPYAIAFRPDDRQLAIATGPTIRIFEANDWHETAVLPAHASASVVALRYSQDGRHLIAGVAKVVQVWSAETSARLITLGDHSGGPITAVSLSPNGRFVAAFGGGVVTIWELTQL